MSSKLGGIGNINYKRVLLHILYWMGVIVYFSYFIGYPDTFWLEVKETLRFLIFDLFVVYFSLYFLIPNLLIKGRRFLFFLFFLVTSFSSLLVQRVIYFEFITTEFPEDFNYMNVPVILRNYIVTLSIYISAVVIKITKIWYNKKIEAAEIKKIQFETELKLKEAELKLLKSQIHPHFLFNTLNNLYGLTIKKSDLAPDVVIRISELLEYMIYECNAPKVKLSHELKHIQNYIELEKLRYNKQLVLQYEKKGISEKHMIAPLILLPFIENSFKHGVSNRIKDAKINLSITVEEDILNFILSNTKSNNNKSIISNSSGIGLKNVKKRLDIMYKDMYKLDLHDGKTEFKVELQINLQKIENKLYHS